SDIANAYTNTDVWFNTNADGTGGQIQDGSSEAGRKWVTRKIDQFKEAAGLTNPVRMQAYEIGTVLTDITTITIVLFSETQQKNLKLFNWTLTPDNEWASLIQDIDDKVDAGTACATGAKCNAGLKFRLLHALDVLKSRFLVPFGKGWLDGFEFGRESSLFVHPIDNGKKLIAGTVDLILAASKILLKLALLTPQDVIQMITQTINALRAARNAAPSLMNL